MSQQQNKKFDKNYLKLETHYVCFIKGTNIKVLYYERLGNQLARVRYYGHDAMLPIHLLTLEPEYDKTKPTGALFMEEWRWIPIAKKHVKFNNADRTLAPERKGWSVTSHRRYKNEGDRVEIGSICYVMGLPFLKVQVVEEDSSFTYKVQPVYQHPLKCDWYRVSKNALRKFYTMDWTLAKNHFYFNYTYPALKLPCNHIQFRIKQKAYIMGTNIEVLRVIQRWQFHIAIVLRHTKIPIWIRSDIVCNEPFHLPREAPGHVSEFGTDPLYILGYESFDVKIVDETQDSNVMKVKLLALGFTCKVKPRVLTRVAFIKNKNLVTRCTMLHTKDDETLLGLEHSHKEVDGKNINDYNLYPY